MRRGELSTRLRAGGTGTKPPRIGRALAQQVEATYCTTRRLVNTLPSAVRFTTYTPRAMSLLRSSDPFSTPAPAPPRSHGCFPSCRRRRRWIGGVPVGRGGSGHRSPPPDRPGRNASAGRTCRRFPLLVEEGGNLVAFIRVHPRPSVSIRGNKSKAPWRRILHPSAFICIHLRSSASICVHLR